MGVPGFFAWILKNFKKRILKNRLHERPKYLYIDANCLFHPECFKVLENLNEANLTILENKMFERIINYLKFIENFVNPTTMMYISVDGSAPLAKINQQRKRRYKSVVDTKMKNELKLKFGMQIKDGWSNTVITPGTEFMERLHIRLINYYSNLKSKLKYIYSSYHTPGEGEHKILQHIKKHTTDKDSIVIYGLDADLIFLAMASKRTNIYLLRESVHFGFKKEKENTDYFDITLDVAQDLIYVSIPETKNAYNEEIKRIILGRNRTNFKITEATNFTNDLIFICFLLGNDFLPHFPSVNINKGGLDELVDSYIECLEESHDYLISFVNDEVQINHLFFAKLTEKMGLKEKRYFTQTLPNYEEKNRRKTCMAEDEYSKELWNIENLRTAQIEDNIGLGIGEESDWKFRYYEHYFKAIEHQKILVNELCKSYTEGIMWVTKYYFEKCSDWRWQYPYNIAPFISDMAIYLNEISNINNIKIRESGHIPIMTQLLAVIPPIHSKILPGSYQQIMINDNSPIIDLFPIGVTLDMLYKDQYWKCDPMLPPMDIERVLRETRDKKLTPPEKERAKVCGDFEF